METNLYLTQEKVDKIMQTIAIESDNTDVIETFIAEFEDGYEAHFELHEGYLEVLLYDPDSELVAESNWYSTETFKANCSEYTFTIGDEDDEENQVEYIIVVHTVEKLKMNIDHVRQRLINMGLFYHEDSKLDYDMVRQKNILIIRSCDKTFVVELHEEHTSMTLELIHEGTIPDHPKHILIDTLVDLDDYKIVCPECEGDCFTIKEIVETKNQIFVYNTGIVDFNDVESEEIKKTQALYCCECEKEFRFQIIEHKGEKYLFPTWTGYVLG